MNTNKNHEAALKIGQLIAARELLKSCGGIHHLSPEAERALTHAQQSLLQAQVFIEEILEN